MKNNNEDNLLLKYVYNEDLYNNLDENQIDIITLRYTLLQYRKQLLTSIKTLFDIEFAYSKVELREDFNELQNQYNNLQIEIDLLENNFQELINNCKFLIQQTKNILIERDGYYSEWQYVRNILTPRPDWDKCSDIIPHWQKLSIGKTSEQLVDLLINEISDENNNESIPMIITDKNELNTFFQEICIDKFSEKKIIKNRHMRRSITGFLIKEIWSNKLYKENNSEIKLTDYVFDYLKKRFDNKDLAIEISYNIKDACNRYRNNYEINLFWKILTGQIEENVYHYERKEFARILQYFIKFYSKSLLWTIQWSDFFNALQKLYPTWTNERILILINSAKNELKKLSNKTNEVEFLLLFMEDDQGHIGEFLTTIRKQLQLDKYEYIEKIKNILIGQPLVSINQFKQAVQIVDPLISKKELERYVNWIFQSKKILIMDNKEEIIFNQSQNIKIIKQIQTRDFEEVIFRLECCSCFMH